MNSEVDESPAAPAPAAENAEEKPVITRQIILTQYSNGDFSIGAPKEAPPVYNDLPALFGLIHYAKRWVELQWELGELSSKMEVTQRLAAEHRSRVVPVAGSASPAFFGGKARH